MLYHIKVEVNVTDDTGRIKRKQLEYLTDVELFANAEYAGMKEHPTSDEAADVVAIKRSNIKEIVRERTDDERYFLVTAIDTYTDEITGKDKDLKYLILLPAENMDAANTEAKKLLSQGYDMRLKKIEETKIIDILY